MKTLRPFPRWLCLLLFLPIRFFAQGVMFDLQVDLLQTATPGVAMPTSGLVLLVADTTHNGFGLAAVTSVGSGNGNVFSSGLALNGAGGDDLILWRSDLNGGFDTAGLLLATPSLSRGTYGGLTWDTGDPVALFWFPNLTINSVSTAASTPYGMVSGASMPLGQSWVTPGDVSGYQLYFITSNDTGTTGLLGTSDPGLLVASYSVSAIPEPATTVGLAGLATFVCVLVQRRRHHHSRGVRRRAYGARLAFSVLR